MSMRNDDSWKDMYLIGFNIFFGTACLTLMPRTQWNAFITIHVYIIVYVDEKQ